MSGDPSSVSGRNPISLKAEKYVSTRTIRRIGRICGSLELWQGVNLYHVFVEAAEPTCKADRCRLRWDTGPNLRYASGAQ
jgi:hypothetical protein